MLWPDDTDAYKKKCERNNIGEHCQNGPNPPATHTFIVITLEAIRKDNRSSKRKRKPLSLKGLPKANFELIKIGLRVSAASLGRLNFAPSSASYMTNYTASISMTECAFKIKQIKFARYSRRTSSFRPLMKWTILKSNIV